MFAAKHVAPGHNKLTNTPTYRQTDRQAGACLVLFITLAVLRTTFAYIPALFAFTFHSSSNKTMARKVKENINYNCS